MPERSRSCRSRSPATASRFSLSPTSAADGHLVALREGDLAFLHVHPLEAEAEADADAIRFATEFPSEGEYRLFLQFKDGGSVHTAEFTRAVGPGG